jgi:hypothetical protein
MLIGGMRIANADANNTSVANANDINVANADDINVANAYSAATAISSTRASSPFRSTMLWWLSGSYHHPVSVAPIVPRP